MALNFPLNPTPGQVYTDPATGLTYVWNNTIGAFEPAEQPPVIVSETQPTTSVAGRLWYKPSKKEFKIYDGTVWITPGIINPIIISDTAPTQRPNTQALQNGDLWWDNVGGVLYVYYQDNDSNQWVSSTPTPGIADVPPGTALDPGISFEGDENTGIFSAGDGNVSITSNGVHTVSIDGSGIAAVNSTGSWKIPTGTLGQRPSPPAIGMIRYNTTYNIYEGYNGSTWDPLTGPGRTVTSVTPPTTPPPIDGDFWFNDETGGLFMYYTDDDTSQWIQVGGTDLVDGILPVTSGGTGATDAATARINLGAVAKAGDTFTGNVGIGGSPSYPLDVTATSAIKIPVGTDAQRPTAVPGLIRYNTTSGTFEGRDASSWRSFVESGDSSSVLNFTQSGTGAVSRTVDSKLKDWVSVKDFGAVGDGVADDTAAIQAALDSTGNNPIYFPPGTYKVTGSGSACLTLSREIRIFGAGRASRIRADSAGASTNLLNVAITNAGGYGDSRQLVIRDLLFFHNGGGNHCIYFARPGSGVLFIASAQIVNCVFTATTGKYSIYVDNNLAHSLIEGCTFNNAYLECLDANVISKCNIFGTGVGITYNLTQYGVRNNTVRECTITNRDGAIVITRGDNIRILNNQLEVALGYTPSQNQSTPSAMIYIAGTPTYNVVNTVIRDNNFGGGTNVNYLIYIDRAQRTLISGNNFIASDIDDIYFTNVSRDNILMSDNLTQGTISNPRTRTYFKTQVTDLGLGNMGVLQLASRLNPQAYWTAPRFFKDTNGFIHFDGPFSGGQTGPGAILGILPDRFRPPADTTLLVSTDAGVGQVNVSTLGVITSKSLPSNVNVLLPPFQADKMEGYDKIGP